MPALQDQIAQWHQSLSRAQKQVVKLHIAGHSQKEISN
jgi:DNA-binding CsgD family transcriptional regulator